MTLVQCVISKLSRANWLFYNLLFKFLLGDRQTITTFGDINKIPGERACMHTPFSKAEHASCTILQEQNDGYVVSGAHNSSILAAKCPYSQQLSTDHHHGIVQFVFILFIIVFFYEDS